MQIKCPGCQLALAVNPADEFHICPGCRQTFRFGAANVPEKEPLHKQSFRPPRQETSPPAIRPARPRRATGGGSSSGWGIGTIIVVIMLARIPLRCAGEFGGSDRRPPSRLQLPDIPKMPEFENNLSQQHIQELLKSIRERKRMEQIDESPGEEELIEPAEEVELPGFLRPPSLEAENPQDEGSVSQEIPPEKAE